MRVIMSDRRTPDEIRKIDAICDSFKSELQVGRDPSIADYLMNNGS